MSTATLKSVPETTKIPNKIKRKVEAKKANYDPKSFSLDPLQFVWNPFCRKKGCYGRGFTGFEEKSQKYMLCRCASPMKDPKKKLKDKPKGTK